jgi:hypothetical protein
MYCPKCGEENPEGAKFCMHCGADLSGYKVEISPKISVTAKAEGGVALKWKKKPEEYVEIEEYGELPVYLDFVELEDKPFCPLCGNYDCLRLLGNEDGIYKVPEKGEEKKEVYKAFYIYRCLACENQILQQIKELSMPEVEKYLIVEGEKIPVYEGVMGSTYRPTLDILKTPGFFEWEGRTTKWKNWKQMINEYGWEKRQVRKGEGYLGSEYWILEFYRRDRFTKFLSLMERDGLDWIPNRGKDDLSEFLSLMKSENLDSHDSNIFPNPILCPICKQKNSIKPVITVLGIYPTSIYKSKDTVNISICSMVKSENVGHSLEHILYSLSECKNCGEKFLIKQQTIEYGDLIGRYIEPWHLPTATIISHDQCEFCGNMEGISSCYVCGKGVCENCAVTGSIKRGVFSKRPVKVCPNCAKKG